MIRFRHNGTWSIWLTGLILLFFAESVMELHNLFTGTPFGWMENQPFESEESSEEPFEELQTSHFKHLSVTLLDFSPIAFPFSMAAPDLLLPNTSHFKEIPTPPPDSMLFS